jgi:predicted kinase
MGQPTLIWLNGAFGSGKTSVAKRLVRACSQAWLLDPERIGFELRRTMPETRGRDFQELPRWQELTLQAAQQAAEAWPERPAIVPMALVDPDRFDGIVGELRRRGVAVHHFSLLASPETLRRRLRWRLDRPASRRWALAQIGRFELLREPPYAVHVETDGRKVAAIAGEIVARLPAEVAARFPGLAIFAAAARGRFPR